MKLKQKKIKSITAWAIWDYDLLEIPFTSAYNENKQYGIFATRTEAKNELMRREKVVKVKITPIK